LLPASVNAPDERAYEYAANTVLAGTYNEKRAITILAGEKEQTFYPDSNTQRPAGKDLLSLRMLSSGIGYIRIHNSLGDNELIKAFDGALDSLSSAAALILDLRETPGGGNTTVARGLMSRFIQKEMPYQKHSLPNEERRYGVKRSWVEYVSPRGRAFTKPVVVLVGRWTGSMGEGIAIAFDGMKRAKVVGDRMAGLLGAIYSYRLTETGFGFALPVEKLFHVNGTPREKFLPLYRESDPRKCLQLGVRLLQKGKAEPRP
jgi:carboxyl-terminal processing protease